MEPEGILDPIDFLRKLHASEIRYLLVGRQAMVLLGAPVTEASPSHSRSSSSGGE